METELCQVGLFEEETFLIIIVIIANPQINKQTKTWTGNVIILKI